MPCTYTSINIKQRNEQKAKQDQKKKVDEKYNTLLLILNEMGFTDITEEQLDAQQVLITAKDK